MPAFFKGQGNDFFQGATETKLTGLGHILNEAGYVSRYIVGNVEFAGVSDLLSTYGIKTISEKNTLAKIENNFLHDYDLFNEAKQQIKEFQKNADQPFALFLSTINTHFPDGIYDKRMEQHISRKDSNLEFSAASIDYLVGDFIDFLRKSLLLENTAIFIFPDYLMMGVKGDNKLNKSERQLYLLSNIDERTLGKNTNNTIYQINLPRLIVSGAAIDTNAKFLTDFIKNRDVNEFLNNEFVKLTSLNVAAITREDYKGGIEIKIRHNKLTIRSGNIHNNITFSRNDKISTRDDVYDFTFTPEMNLICNGRVNPSEAFDLSSYDKKHKRLHLIIFIKNGQIKKVYFGNKRGTDFYVHKPFYLTEGRIMQTMKLNNQNQRTKLTDYQKDVNRFIAHAGGIIDGITYTNSKEALDSNYKKGFRLFELDIIKTSDDIYVAAHDWKHWASITGYAGSLPPNKKIFKQHKIQTKYTPMDIDDINLWFKNHSDAVLVTDKINTPHHFSNQFVDKNRLMMELFTWDAVKKGIKAKIKSSIPSWNLLNQLKGSQVPFLKKLGVT